MTPKEMASNMFYSFLSTSVNNRVDEKDICKKSCQYAINLILMVVDESMLYKQKKRDFWELVKEEIDNF